MDDTEVRLTGERLRRSESSNPAPEGMPACQSCRRKKIKCSREQPSCSQCSRLSCDCIYDTSRLKPGVRSGAIESINRRLETLERLMLERQSQGQGVQDSPPHPNNAQGCLYHAALLIANEFKNKTAPPPSTQRNSQYQNCELDLDTDSRQNIPAVNRSRKRKHQDDSQPLPAWDRLNECANSLPDDGALQQIIKAYFGKVHHWMPFIHQRRFRARLDDPGEASSLVILLHAMVVVAIRQVDSPDFSLDQSDIEQQIRVSRNVVMLNAMNQLSVENLQALSLVAFDHLESAKFPRAWAIIGSLVRSVDYLQLNMELDEQPRRSFMRPLTLLPKPLSFVEIEEQRRVFWIIFLLDRFTSATSGWSTGLSAMDVRRRVPCAGTIWAREEDVVTTPFLGILDKSTARIGSLVSGIGLRAEASHDGPSPPGTTADLFNIGAVSVRIEATESLIQVTSLFLQHEVDFNHRDEVNRWLVIFKELDVRLVQWKLFFPQRWSRSSVSKEKAVLEMDQNLTLAHLIHNASIILLHQHIAYPSAELTRQVQLPTSCSAETCHLAAVEISSIIGRFFSYVSYLVAPEFSFCAFIAAKVLLVHWRFYNTELHPECSKLLTYLQGISRRWRGCHSSTLPRSADMDEEIDLAAKYASELQLFHDKLLNDREMLPQVLMQPFSGVYADMDTSAIHHPDTGLFIGLNVDPDLLFSNQRSSPNVSATSGGQPPPRRSKRTAGVIHEMNLQDESGTASLSDLRADPPGDIFAIDSGVISQSLFSQQFTEMDRVFTLDGTDFAFDMDGWDGA